jgi:hypothetical protein
MQARISFKKKIEEIRLKMHSVPYAVFALLAMNHASTLRPLFFQFAKVMIAAMLQGYNNHSS